MPNAAIHPTAQELTAFALGKLPEAAANTIASHLEKCPACRQAIEKLPADSFVGKLRAAKPGVSALPAQAGAATNMPALPVPPKDLPPELASYSKYRFVRELGRGGMGVVYQAEQTVMGRTVAVKVINPSVLAHPDALPRFQSEVRAAAKLDHPNIVRAHDAEQVGSMHLLVMEYVEGTSLAELVAQKGSQSIAYACHYIRQAALGLQHAFEQGMVHRDIKPQNLMVNARGQVKVLDFGLARMRSERKAGGGLTQADAFMGTPEYVAPEQATDARSADTRADIYSLGCTLFFLLTGRPPFQENTIVKQILAQIEKEAPALQEVRADVPAELSAVVAKMLAKDPAQRFQTPVEVAQALAMFVKAGTKRGAGVSSPASGASSPGTGTVMAADTSRIKAILREVPGKTSASNVPAKAETASVFAGLGEPLVSTKKKAKPTPKRAEPVAAAWYRRWPVLAGVGATVLALGLGAWLLAGIVFKTKVKTPDGEAFVVLENLPADAEVLVDGGTVTVKWSNGKAAEVRVPPGKKHRIEVKKEGFKVFGEEVEVDAGGSKPLLVRMEKIPEPIPGGPTRPPEKQAEAVLRELKARNPGFEGTWAKAPEIVGDRIVSLFIQSDHVRDLTPLQALPHLRMLDVRTDPSSRGALTDLGPLKGLPLEELYLGHQPVADLSPLRDLRKLRRLTLSHTKVTDLTPLQGLSLNYLFSYESPVLDLSPLSGMKELEHLEIIGGHSLTTDLKPLEGLKLRALRVYGRSLEDLSPLKGMPLKHLDIHRTRVKDLSPLKGMKLVEFEYYDTPVEDISVLKDMPLEVVECNFQRERDEAVLRSIKTLQRINGKPAAQFWKEVDGTNTSGGSATEEKEPSRDKGFVSLFNGKDLDGWTALNGRPAEWEVRDGFVEVTPGKGNIMTKEKFGPDFQLHAEFWLPLMPDAKGQGRANSGIFLQGRYEVQILDSYQNDTYDTGSVGALYNLIAPDKEAQRKAILPPEQWNTYDITFHAPRVDEKGKVTEKGRVTVVLNGITLIKEGTFDRISGGALDDEMGMPGPILLQDHGNKVRFRKIEIKELPAKSS